MSELKSRPSKWIKIKKKTPIKSKQFLSKQDKIKKGNKTARIRIDKS